MKIARRTLLRLLGGSGIALQQITGPLKAATEAQPFFLIFDDISADTPVDAFETLLSPFAVAGIPTGFIVKPADATDAPMPAPSAIAAVITEHLRVSPDLGEVIAWAPEIADAPPYFQIRAASAARARLEAFLGMSGKTRSDANCLLNIAAIDRLGFPSLDAIRPAGFRGVLLLSLSNEPSLSDRCLNNVACIRGSMRRKIVDEAPDIIVAVSTALQAGEMALLTLSLKQIGEVPLDTLRTRAQMLADALSRDIIAGRIFAALPKAHLSWFSSGNERLIGLRVDAPPAKDPVADSAFAEFQAALSDADIPFSISANRLDPEITDENACVALTPFTKSGEVPTPGATDAVACVVAGSLPPFAEESLAEAGIQVILHPSGADIAGMDENGVLHLSEGLSVAAAVGAEQDIGAIDPCEDVVISVAATAYASAEGRAAILSMLKGMLTASQSKILTVTGFAKAILPEDPVYRVMLATRRNGQATSTTSQQITDQERDALLEDARIAWSYLARTADKTTGICPSTVHFEGEWTNFYEVQTMWDLGSQIQATMASHELGIIDDVEYALRSEDILRALPSETIAGNNLPSSEISTTTLVSVSKDFNSCDTGRLLSALADFDRYPHSKGACADMVATWDLGRTVRNGRFNSITNGRFQPHYRTHCAHYASRAYKLWGVTGASPYDDAYQGDSLTDARMRLLYEVDEIGALGAEPMLLEAIELGFSDPSAYLADVLFAAQERSFAATGELICASEGAIDRPPWFTYQGLRLDSDSGDWDVVSIDTNAEYQTESFRRSTRFISTKAAFLWAAVKPGSYSRMLLDHVRLNARSSEAGYSSGVYSATGAAMQNYSDINTNGVILQAIAYVLRGSGPRFKP